MTVSNHTTPTPVLSVAQRLTAAGYLIVVFLLWTSVYIYVPTLPIFVQSKTGSLTMVGIVIAQYGLLQAIARLPLGILTDWVGQRKPFIIAGLVCSGLGAWMMVSLDNDLGLIFGRGITGLAAACWVPLVVAFSSLYPPEEAIRASSILTFVSSGSRMLATATTGWLNDSGGYSLAFYLAIAIASLAVLILLPIKEAQQPLVKPSLKSVTKLITRRDVYLPPLLAVVIHYAIYSTTFSFIPILAEKLGATNTMQSLLTSLSLGATTFGNLLAASLVKRTGTRPLILSGYVSIFIGCGLAALTHTISLIVIAQLFIGLSLGIAYPVLMGMSIIKVEEAERATAMGLFQSVYAIGMFAGPWLSGYIAEAIGLQPMLAFTGVACFLLGSFGIYRLKVKV
jgi:MFS family permease